MSGTSTPRNAHNPPQSSPNSWTCNRSAGTCAVTRAMLSSKMRMQLSRVIGHSLRHQPAVDLGARRGAGGYGLNKMRHLGQTRRLVPLKKEMLRRRPSEQRRNWGRNGGRIRSGMARRCLQQPSCNRGHGRGHVHGFSQKIGLPFSRCRICTPDPWLGRKRKLQVSSLRVSWGRLLVSCLRAGKPDPPP